MGTEIVPETSASFSLLTWLIAREDFINSCRRESFKSYIGFYMSDVRQLQRVECAVILCETFSFALA
jgi:hypothetical protein